MAACRPRVVGRRYSVEGGALHGGRRESVDADLDVPRGAFPVASVLWGAVPGAIPVVGSQGTRRRWCLPPWRLPLRCAPMCSVGAFAERGPGGMVSASLGPTASPRTYGHRMKACAQSVDERKGHLSTNRHIGEAMVNPGGLVRWCPARVGGAASAASIVSLFCSILGVVCWPRAVSQEVSLVDSRLTTRTHTRIRWQLGPRECGLSWIAAGRALDGGLRGVSRRLNP